MLRLLSFPGVFGFFVCFGVTSCGVPGLPLAQGVLLAVVKRFMCGAGDQTQVDFMQCKSCNYCTLAWLISYL